MSAGWRRVVLRAPVKQSEGSLQQHADGPTGNGRLRSDLCRLLHAYEETLAAARRLPLVVMMPFEPRYPRLLHWVGAPRPRFIVRAMLRRHIRRTLEALLRHYRARSALGVAADRELHDRQAVELYLESLPPPASRVRLAVIGGIALTLGSRVVVAAANFFSSGILSLPLAGRDEELPTRMKHLADKLAAVLTLTDQSIGDAINALVSSKPADLFFLAVALLAVAYAVCRPLVPAFRLKRMLLCLYPSFEDSCGVVSARWSVRHSTGIYRLERQVFEGLGYDARREFPLDLVVSVLPALVVAVIALDGVAEVLADSPYPGDILAAFVVLAVCGTRLSSLSSTWRSRSRPSAREATWLHLPGDRQPLRVESPSKMLAVSAAAVALVASGMVSALAPGNGVEELESATGIAFALVSVYAALWWYRVARELRHVIEVRAGQVDGRPFWSAVAVTAGLFALLPAALASYGLARRVRKAQVTAGTKRLCRTPVVLGLMGLALVPLAVFEQTGDPWVVYCPLTLPLLALYVQGSLNSLWRTVGVPFEFGRLDHGIDVSDSAYVTGTDTVAGPAVREPVPSPAAGNGRVAMASASSPASTRSQ